MADRSGRCGDTSALRWQEDSGTHAGSWQWNQGVQGCLQGGGQSRIRYQGAQGLGFLSFWPSQALLYRGLVDEQPHELGLHAQNSIFHNKKLASLFPYPKLAINFGAWGNWAHFRKALVPCVQMER